MELENTIIMSADVVRSANLTGKLSDVDLNTIGQRLFGNYTTNLNSRSVWESRMENALDLAMQVEEEKSWPWPGCSNVIFPLVTIAAMQFHARAYPLIVNGDKVVKCTVAGKDPQGLERLRADRVANYMSYQLLGSGSWEEDLDRSLLNIAIVGCGFTKTYRCNGEQVSEYVHARDFVLDYFARSVDTARLKTHVYEMSRNDIYERVMSGVFVDILDCEWYTSTAAIPNTEARDRANQRAGLDTPQASDDTPFTILEHHCWLDLDGDGYEEPYIVVQEFGSQAILRICLRCDRVEDIIFNDKNQVVLIHATEYFTKRPFIPSPDGAIYDIGFGVLLGPLNDSVNSAINQLFDSGTLANTAGGFLGRGAKIRGGSVEFRPFGWNRVDSSGDDLRKNIMPLPVREPSSVMFQLLGLIIDYTNRISGATDMLVGENPGQNTPAQTSQAMLEQGQKIYSAIYKRVWRSLKFEFQKLYKLNAIYLSGKVPFGVGGNTISREDFLSPPGGICPVADPSITSEGTIFARARMLKEAAAATPGYNSDAVERQYLNALGYTDTDFIFPGTEGQPPAPSEKIQIQQMKNEIAMAQLELQKQQVMGQLQIQSALNEAKIAELNARAQSLMIESNLAEQDLRIQAFRAAIEALREQNKNNDSQIKQLMELGTNVAQTATAGIGELGTAGVPGMVGASGDGQAL